MEFNNNGTLISPGQSRLRTSCSEDQTTIPSDRWTPSNLARSVYCVLGIPVDAINLTTLLQRIEAAAINRETLFLSTPNLNFLVNSLSNPEFRESLLDSDLCPPDGIPINWIARILGLPIKERAAGSDLFEKLRFRSRQSRAIGIFLFGGAQGVAAAAAEKLNRQSGVLTCVGFLDPGFGDVLEMSQDDTIDAINSSGADFLLVSLGAKKGQEWLRHNHNRLTIPIRSHLGAAINFLAGNVKRAPAAVSAWGFEWLWRVKEEPHLWKRYRDDGLVFLRLLVTRVLPLAVIMRWQRLRIKQQAQDLVIRKSCLDHSITVSLCGSAIESQVPKAVFAFQECLSGKKDVVIDLSATCLIDCRFMGLLLMLRKELVRSGARLTFISASRSIERVFRLNELGFLLASTGSGKTTSRRLAERSPAAG